jgi:hypothetical protein
MIQVVIDFVQFDAPRTANSTHHFPHCDHILILNMRVVSLRCGMGLACTGSEVTTCAEWSPSLLLRGMGMGMVSACVSEHRRGSVPMGWRRRGRKS